MAHATRGASHRLWIGAALSVMCNGPRGNLGCRTVTPPALCRQHLDLGPCPPPAPQVRPFSVGVQGRLLTLCLGPCYTFFALPMTPAPSVSYIGSTGYRAHPSHLWPVHVLPPAVRAWVCHVAGALVGLACSVELPREALEA